MRTYLAVLAVLLIAAPAAAEQPAPAKRAAAKRGKARPKPPPVDVAGAVASGDPDRLCGAAIELAARDAARARLLIGACADLPARAAAAKTARAAIDKIAERDQWSPVELVLVGKGAAAATVSIDAFPDVPLAAGSWRLPAGTYRFTARTAGGEATYDLVLAENSRALVMIEPPLPPQPPRDGVLDFGTDDEPLDAPIAGPPQVKHESLLPERFRKLMKTCGAMACRKAP